MRPSDKEKNKTGHIGWGEENNPNKAPVWPLTLRTTYNFVNTGPAYKLQTSLVPVGSLGIGTALK